MIKVDRRKKRLSLHTGFIILLAIFCIGVQAQTAGVNPFPPTPGPDKPGLTDVLPLPKSAPRADALLMIEHSGTIAQTIPTPGAVSAPQTASRDARTFHGRY